MNEDEGKVYVYMTDSKVEHLIPASCFDYVCFFIGFLFTKNVFIVIILSLLYHPKEPRVSGRKSGEASSCL